MMLCWIKERIGEASTHLGALLAACGAYAAANADEVAEAYHEVTSGHVGRATVRVAGALLAAVGGVLIGTPKKEDPECSHS